MMEDKKVLSEMLESISEDHPDLENRLKKMGGVKVLASKLGSDLIKGIDSKERGKMAEAFGNNELPTQDTSTWMELFLGSFNDTTLIVLIVSAIVSLAVGVYDNPQHGWIEGAAILFAVLLVAIVTATNDFEKESQFQKLNAVKEDVNIQAVRDGKTISINTKELVVGDLVKLNAGDKIPADGILVSGSDVACDQSGLTGESIDVEKGAEDNFLLSGTNVSSGYCTMLVIAVGSRSRYGKLRASLTTESVDTPLQEKLDTLAGQIGNGGMVAAGATFIAMLVVWYYSPEDAHKPTLFEYTLKAFIMAVTIVVVAVPEGLPLAVTLSLAFSTQKMMADNNLIRVLAACETMGNATNICSDKTGTLTQNKMTVVEGWVGGKHHKPFPSKVCADIKLELCEGISVNSTASLVMKDNQVEVLGSKTEGALLMMIKDNFECDYQKRRSDGFNTTRGDRLFTFSSDRKRMSVLQLADNGKYHHTLYTKGASEVIVGLCKSFTSENGTELPLGAAEREAVEAVISDMASRALRTIAMAHRNFNSKPSESAEAEDLEKDMVLDGIVGIIDPLRPDVADAVKRCQDAGIFVRMVTGDNIQTAKAIASECGILTTGGECMEGPAFRKLTPKQLDDVLPRLQVLARSSPQDKYLLVSRLNGNNLPTSQAEWHDAHPGKDWDDRDYILPGYKAEWEVSRDGGVGEVVGVTGDGTNDGPALKAADVGLSMGLSGTEVAKEASDIVILDDNFKSIVKAVVWGRSVFDNIRKFLQFQLTVNVVALTVTFISAVFGFDPPLNAVMMLWVNLIMDTMGALALGTEPPSPSLLNRRPYKRDASLISNVMWRNILVQSVFQVALLGYLLLLGAEDFDVKSNSVEHITIVFNTFVICQIFNEFNARSIGNDMNVFRGLAENPIFVGIIIFTILAQYGLVEYGGDFVKTAPLSQENWVKCIELAALTIPLGGVMRLLPYASDDKDFAATSDLLKDRANSKKGVDNNGSNNSSISDGISFLVWLAVVGVVPALIYQDFGDMWLAHYAKFATA